MRTRRQLPDATSKPPVRGLNLHLALWACVSDAHCSEGQLCVEQVFQEQSVGHFCFWQLGGGNGAPDNCLSEGARPYADYVAGALSIDGVEADICGLAVSTCIARTQFRTNDCANAEASEPEPDSSQCGLVAPNDAVCIEAPGPTGSPPVYLCTMRCGSDYDCPSGFTCNTDTTTPYCEL